MTPTDRDPMLAIISGNPSADEIAAVVVVLAALSQPARVSVAPEAKRSEWSAKSRLVRAPLRRGPGAWRASALPR